MVSASLITLDDSTHRKSLRERSMKRQFQEIYSSLTTSSSRVMEIGNSIDPGCKKQRELSYSMMASRPNAVYPSPSMAKYSDPHHPSARNEVLKFCRVCGDIAKSFHFGGLSCDSCKSFFRRSVQNDNYRNFMCRFNNECTISTNNRKHCRSCRIRRCLAIGMEKSWVRTEEEREALRKARAVSKVSKRLTDLATMTKINMERTSSCDSLIDERCNIINGYEPQAHRLTEFLTLQEIEEVESIVTKYMHALQQFPHFPDECLGSQPGVRVIKVKNQTRLLY